jgi:YegS/Rv2252/BmrU family lipid kinase
VLVIVNPAAAGGRLGREWPAVAQRLRDIGFDPPQVFTSAPWHATELAAEAVRSGVQVVVAAGGDGTACEVAEGLHLAGGGVLAMLPLGTGNDTARTLGVPTTIDDAAQVALDGGRRQVDLIRMGDKVVLNALGLGLTGEINRRAARIKVVRGIACYLITAVVSVVRFAAPVVRLRSPQQEYEGRMTVLAVHNGPTTGGGFPLTPKASPDDGLLDVCLVPDVGPLGRVPRLLAAMKGTLGQSPGVVELQAPWLELEFEVAVSAHLDGNQYDLDPPGVRFEVLPGALTVAVPAAAGQETVNPEP